MMDVLSLSRLQIEAFTSFQLCFPAAIKWQILLAKKMGSCHTGVSIVPVFRSLD